MVLLKMIFWFFIGCKLHETIKNPRENELSGIVLLNIHYENFFTENKFSKFTNQKE